MKEYKRRLCSCFSGKSEDTIYEFIKDNAEYSYFINERGNLHSNYTGSYYEPAIIHTSRRPVYIKMYWLFDGEIKDCLHPFCVTLYCGELQSVIYYSSERITTNQSIETGYYNKKCNYKCYNMYRGNKILHDSDYTTGDDYSPADDVGDYLFTPEYYPLYDEMDTFKFTD